MLSDFNSKMNIIGDSEANRYFDRVRAVAWKDAGAEFITKKWIAEKLKRSEGWVKRTWEKSYN